MKNKIIKVDEYYEKYDTIGRYTIHKILGEGRYGIVYLAFDEKNNEYIIKQLKKDMLRETGKKVFYEEMILRSLRNPCFPKFITKFKDGTRVGYILEYMEGTVLEDLLIEEQYQFNRSEIYEIGSKLIKLVETLHNHNIVHRDIRLPNVIRKENNELALIDFGLARIIDHKRYTEQIDYWYIGDFLIHLYYSSFKVMNTKERPWYRELDLNSEEKEFLKRLMGIEEPYHNIQEIKEQMENIKNTN